ncbi:arylsulfatase G-like [Schistocerca serialis cubense]|uniref:arylsulfatase G-like n=1 Tax=Schistocerca serialis cubense TaxID=2023355 RepID=UPI00214EE244|nr:arylsulfatase G-like [Schistocerca serialis cubense]XP_049947379.1 arylsulfatase G-like [Schistocerca serialis cubense]
MAAQNCQRRYKFDMVLFLVMIFNSHLSCMYVSGNFISGDHNESPGTNQSPDVTDSVAAVQNNLTPNIVLIMADDLGWGDFGSYSPYTALTPNLDAIAKEGIRFTDFHVGSSVCTPSRGALLTGRLGLRTGIVKHLTADAVGGIAENETTLAEILLDAGYRTGMFGKWHLGTQPGHQPLDKGFQTYLGIPYSVDMGCADPPGANYPSCPACPYGNVSRMDPFPICTSDLALPLYSNRTIIHQPAKLEELSDIFADFADEFISQSTEPFFLYAALQHVHVPLAHGPIFDNITGKGTFADTLLEMDWLVGRVVQAAMNHSRNTLVWILSDNGPWEMKCDLAGSCGPFAGKWQRDVQGGGGGGAQKNTVWECGHRVPSLVLWPDHVQPGSVSEALVSSLDIMPTIAAILNISLPSDRFYDGINIQDILIGQSSVGHEVLFHPNSGSGGPDGEIGAVRIGDYKVVYYTGGSQDCDYNTGPTMSHFSSPLVFNIKNDPEEGTPLSVNSTEWLLTVQAAEEALTSLEISLQQDNTSTVNYTTDPSVRPCCNIENSICRCPWD